MQNLMLLTYNFSKVIEEKPLGGGRLNLPFGKGRVKKSLLCKILLLTKMLY